MNTVELDRILNKLLSRSQFKYLDVFALEYSHTPLIKNIDKQAFPLCFVSNTHSSSKPGQLWVASYLTYTHYLEFFDSYGLTPSSYDFYITISPSNPYMLQRLDSNVCAHYIFSISIVAADV